MKTLDPEQLPDRTIYELLTGMVVPRPIALVTTQSRDDVLNCAPFSFYQGVCGAPPLISLSISKNRSGLKDTFRNILLTGEFVVHASREEHLEQVEKSSQSFGPQISEVERIGFTTTESDKVAVPGLQEPPARMECQLHDQFPIAGANVTVVYGEVINFHLEDEIYNGEEVDYERFNPLARLGPDAYTTLGKYIAPKRRLDSEETADG